MALSELNNKFGVLPLGESGRALQWGSFAFSTTDATGTVKVKMRVVEAVLVLPDGAPATDETLYWADALSTSGQFIVGADGLITIGRTGAAKTSALKASYLIIGH